MFCEKKTSNFLILWAQPMQESSTDHNSSQDLAYATKVDRNIAILLLLLYFYYIIVCHINTQIYLIGGTIWHSTSAKSAQKILRKAQAFIKKYQFRFFQRKQFFERHRMNRKLFKF